MEPIDSKWNSAVRGAKQLKTLNFLVFRFTPRTLYPAPSLCLLVQQIMQQIIKLIAYINTHFVRRSHVFALEALHLAHNIVLAFRWILPLAMVSFGN